MTKKHFEFMAALVNRVRVGDWGNYIPEWADADEVSFGYSEQPDYDSAVRIAESFIALAEAFNPHFDRSRFLRACGLESVS